MKKALALTLMGLALAAAAGCGAKEEENKLEMIKEKGVLVMATSPDFAPYEFQDVSAARPSIWARRSSWENTSRADGRGASAGAHGFLRR